jgi:hypothetical protein
MAGAIKMLCCRCHAIKAMRYGYCKPCRRILEKARYKKDNLFRTQKRKYSTRWYLANKDRAAENHRQWRRKLRLETFAAYGDKCNCCTESSWEFLSIDHMEGGGARLKERGLEFYSKLKKLGFPKDKYRLLCHNCNQSRGSYGYCPHERTKV